MILVTAGVLSVDGALLVCQRRAGGPFGLKWEFPGGKVEPGESSEACLARELSEELGIAAEVGPELFRTEHAYPDGFTVRLVFFRVRRYQGTPINRAFERMEWARPEDLPTYDFLEADREFVAWLQRDEIVDA